MTEYELLQLQAAYDEAIATYIMNFISILSGYLLANHFLGLRITKAQFLIMTATYTFVMALTSLAAYNAIEQYHLAEDTLAGLNRSWDSSYGRARSLAVPLLMALFITYIGSIYFSITSRKQNKIRT